MDAALNTLISKQNNKGYPQRKKVTLSVNEKLGFWKHHHTEEHGNVTE